MSKKKNIKKFKSILESLLTSAYDDMNNRLTVVEGRLDCIECSTDDCGGCGLDCDEVEETFTPNSLNQIMLTNMRQLTSYMDNLPIESRLEIWRHMGIKNMDSCYINVEDRREQPYLMTKDNEQ